MQSLLLSIKARRAYAFCPLRAHPCTCTLHLTYNITNHNSVSDWFLTTNNIQPLHRGRLPRPLGWREPSPVMATRWREQSHIARKCTCPCAFTYVAFGREKPIPCTRYSRVGPISTCTGVARGILRGIFRLGEARRRRQWLARRWRPPRGTVCQT